jgi:hypothetical protein
VSRYRYVSCHPVLRNQLDPSLRFIDAEWSWVVGGNGTLAAKITVPESQSQIDQLKIATAPKQAAIYVRNDATGTYPWGGVVIKRKWSRASNQITITCMEWRAWFYNIIMGPGASTDITYGLAASDQLVIARDLVADALAGGTAVGVPPLLTGSETSGKQRDLTFLGSQMKYLGQQLDTVANRDGGFEWSIESRPGTIDGLPQLWFVPYFPERGTQAAGVSFRATEGGRGNFIPGDIEEDHSDRYERFWTTGAGTAPDATWAVDSDPELATGTFLRFDGAASFSTVSDRNTLASHARRSRRFYAPGTNLVQGVVPFAKVDPETIQIGDRV